MLVVLHHHIQIKIHFIDKYTEKPVKGIKFVENTYKRTYFCDEMITLKSTDEFLYNMHEQINTEIIS